MLLGLQWKKKDRIKKIQTGRKGGRKKERKKEGKKKKMSEKQAWCPPPNVIVSELYNFTHTKRWKLLQAITVMFIKF